jgi:hypothetical protein
MPSPFPGMDPYLENPGWWPDFHHFFISGLSEGLDEILPGRYIAEIEAHEFWLEPDELPAPNVVQLDPISIGFIEIREHPKGGAVTTVEVLSPVTKGGSGRSTYSAIRRKILLDGINLVEVDLLRGGQRPRWSTPPPLFDYCVTVSRADRSPEGEFYGWNLRRALPQLPIPLMSPEPDVLLNVGEVLAKTYERGGYRKKLEYGEVPPGPGMSEDDREWVKQMIRGRAGA